VTTYAEQFARDGYTVVKGLFSGAEIAELLNALEGTISKVNADFENYLTRYTVKDEQHADTWGVNDILRPDLYHPSYGEVFEKQPLMDLIREILGERLRFWAAHALWSPELFDYDLNWHRDFGDDERYDPAGGATHCYINLALVEDRFFHIIPGSNRRPLTEAERAEQLASGFGSLPGEKVVVCGAGDVLLMNGHAFHRGSCPATEIRRTLHIALQPYDEPTGGHGSWKYIRKGGFLQTMKPTVRKLMEAMIAWEDSHPLDLPETVRRMRISKQHMDHRAVKPI
jgi:ectoine hydroxylase-related dioxygenase (phytanoyl-CoA dioxygenase family)